MRHTGSVKKIPLSATNADNIGFLKRYGCLFFKTVTPGRVLNAVRSTYGYILGLPEAKSYPLVLKFETSAVCNLACVGCMHGIGEENKYFSKDMMISYEDFKKVIDETGKYLFMVIMYHRGEPFFNKEIFRMLEYLKKYNIASTISSNFSLRFKEEDFSKMVGSGLTHLVLSIDGTTQGIYQKYRRGGSLDLIKHNIRELVKTKKRLKSKTPITELQFVIFEHNAHQVKEVKSFARDLGIDRISFLEDITVKEGVYMGLGGAEDIENRAIKKKKVLPLCDWPWYAALVKWNGEVFPCCDYDWKIESLDFGNIKEDSFWNIWSGRRYIDLRKSLSNPKDAEELDSFCSGCLSLRICKKPVNLEIK